MFLRGQLLRLGTRQESGGGWRDGGGGGGRSRFQRTNGTRLVYRRDVSFPLRNRSPPSLLAFKLVNCYADESRETGRPRPRERTPSNICTFPPLLFETIQIQRSIASPCARLARIPRPLPLPPSGFQSPKAGAKRGGGDHASTRLSNGPAR